MANLYKKLALHLDKMPAGFPATDSGVEVKILERLFTQEEAAIVLGWNLCRLLPNACQWIRSVWVTHSWRCPKKG